MRAGGSRVPPGAGLSGRDGRLLHLRGVLAGLRGRVHLRPVVVRGLGDIHVLGLTDPRFQRGLLEGAAVGEGQLPRTERRRLRFGKLPDREDDRVSSQPSPIAVRPAQSQYFFDALGDRLSANEAFRV